MPLYLPDTNILLAYVRGQRLYSKIDALYTLRAVRPVPVISVVSAGELHSLSRQFNWGAARQQTMQELLDYFTVVPLPYQTIVEVYAEIDDYSKRRGVPMGKNDVWIAATAHVTGARLLTTDRDFDHLDPTFLGRDWVDPAT